MRQSRHKAPTRLGSKITAIMVCKVLDRNATTIQTAYAQLWLAVIKNAIKESTTRSYRKECQRFFESRYFDTICDRVGLDPQYTRDIINRIGQIHNVEIIK